MKDINDIIDHVVLASGCDEKTAERLIRSVFADIQDFANEKKGVCIQVPFVGTFKFRSHAIPNYVNREKGALVYWISRLFIGQHRQLVSTITTATSNIQTKFYHLRKVSQIKDEYMKKHGRYRPTIKKYLADDTDSDMARVDEYINLLAAQIFVSETSPFPSGNL